MLRVRAGSGHHLLAFSCDLSSLHILALKVWPALLGQSQFVTVVLMPSSLVCSSALKLA